MNKSYNNSFTRVSQNNPCIHCNKPDWCYTLEQLTVCSRDAEPASGWYKTTRTDDNGDYFYAPIAETKAPSSLGVTTYQYPDRQGNKLIEVIREDYQDDKGSLKKRIYQRYYNGESWQNSLKGCDERKIPIYRYPEVRRAISEDKIIFIVEGEKCALSLWELGLTATTTKGGLKPWRDEHTRDLEGAERIVLVPDRDEIGVKKMLAVAKHFPDAQWLYAPPNPFFWENLPKSNGLDIADWIASGATSEGILEAITERLPELPQAATVDVAPEKIEPEDNFTQKAYDALYGDTKYIALGQEIYRWNGNYYERLSPFNEKKRIAKWCQTTPIKKRGGGYKYALATPAKVEEIYKWALITNLVDPDKINPPGINCLNGVVTIEWQGQKPVYTLSTPNPDRYYTYCSEIEYNPNCDRTSCDRLLLALEAPQREVFLKTIAASLDLTQIRKLNSSRVKALLLRGTGNNGKDSLWQAVSTILGDSMTQISFSEFQDYDRGSKFNVARLAHSRICWASENSEYISLDKVQILKQAITGEPITIEEKYCQPFQIEPKAVLLFNVNKPPLISGGLEAIKSRYAVLEFNKTFTQDADPERGELEADSRFRYDREFLNREVAPALLNYILEALEAVAVEGIDYSPCQDSLDKIKRQSNHLWEFAEDVGLTADKGSRVYLTELWNKLYEWYKDRGIVEERGDNQIWSPPTRKGDDYVKASRLLFTKLQEIFPQIIKERDTTTIRKGAYYIEGVKMSGSEATVKQSEAKSEAKVKQIFPLQWESEASEANWGKNSLLVFLKDRFPKLPTAEKLEISSLIDRHLGRTPPPKQVSASPPFLPPNPPLTDEPSNIEKTKYYSPPTLQQYISWTEIGDRTIEFGWDDDNTCYEITKTLKPYLYIRIPGTKESQAVKLEFFARIQIADKIYSVAKGVKQ